VYLQSLVVRDEASGLSEVHVCVGGPNVGRLKEAIWAGFQGVLDGHLGERDFSGEIRIVILSEVTPQSPGVWRALAEVEERMRTALRVSKATTKVGRPVSLTVEYTASDEG
jgi:hypothetical protein